MYIRPRTTKDERINNLYCWLSRVRNEQESVVILSTRLQEKAKESGTSVR